MTTPELPYIEGGTIWDGVTQYFHGLPPGQGTAWICRMYMDGTRRFSDTRHSTLPKRDFRVFGE